MMRALLYKQRQACMLQPACNCNQTEVTMSTNAASPALQGSTESVFANLAADLVCYF